MRYLFLTYLAVFVLTSCKDSSPGSVVKWGVHRNAKYANILNLEPNESVEVCAPTEEHVRYSLDAINQWSTAIGRQGHIKINPCGTGSDLKINMETFGSTGLNYFTNNPGRIFVKSGATGAFLHAVILHEFGHSFGLCDQYKAAGSANCSSTRSDRQENSEIMGATNSSKLKLTPGDITGVQKAAEAAPSAAAWAGISGTPPNTGTPPGTLGGQVVNQTTNASNIYAYVVDESPTPVIMVSVPQNSTFQLCQLSSTQLGNVTSCTGATAVTTTRVTTIGSVDIYETSSLQTLTGSQHDFAVDFGQGQVRKFRVSPR